MKRTIKSLLLAVLITFAGTTSAFAHAKVLSTTPSAGSILTDWPSQVSIRFDEPILKLSGAVVDWAYVKNSQGRRVDTGNPKVSGAFLTVGLKSSAKSGKYSVQYRAVSDDGHPVSGIFTFVYLPSK